jgi:hypothetical protein
MAPGELAQTPTGDPFAVRRNDLDIVTDGSAEVVSLHVHHAGLDLPLLLGVVDGGRIDLEAVVARGLAVAAVSAVGPSLANAARTPLSPFRRHALGANSEPQTEPRPTANATMTTRQSRSPREERTATRLGLSTTSATCQIRALWGLERTSGAGARRYRAARTCFASAARSQPVTENAVAQSNSRRRRGRPCRVHSSRRQ